MSDNVEVERGKTESNLSVIKRFSRRMQDAGVIQRLKKERYSEREKSSNVRRNKRLTALGKKAVRDRLIKLGKLAPRRPRGGPRR
ncbi:MAG TPA: hypothetical protein VJJ47_02875 [Candidatus Paceibacterota bacterium]